MILKLLFSTVCSDWVSVLFWSSSGLNGDGRLAGDLSETRAVQSSDHSGFPTPLWSKQLSPGQGGASGDQTVKNRVCIIYQTESTAFRGHLENSESGLGCITH